jgi:hypothetical protein
MDTPFCRSHLLSRSVDRKQGIVQNGLASTFRVHVFKRLKHQFGNGEVSLAQGLLESDGHRFLKRRVAFHCTPSFGHANGHIV